MCRLVERRQSSCRARPEASRNDPFRRPAEPFRGMSSFRKWSARPQEDTGVSDTGTCRPAGELVEDRRRCATSEKGAPRGVGEMPLRNSHPHFVRSHGRAIRRRRGQSWNVKSRRVQLACSLVQGMDIMREVRPEVRAMREATADVGPWFVSPQARLLYKRAESWIRPTRSS